MRKERYELLKHLLNEGHFTVDTWNGHVYGRSGYRIGNIVGTGYEMVSGGGTCFFTHQVVAVASGHDIVGKTINHKDGNKHKNRVDNLEVTTQKENMLHAAKNGLLVNRKLTNEQVREIKRLLAEGESITVISHMYPVSYQSIQSIKYGKSYREVTI